MRLAPCAFLPLLSLTILGRFRVTRASLRAASVYHRERTSPTRRKPPQQHALVVHGAFPRGGIRLRRAAVFGTSKNRSRLAWGFQAPSWPRGGSPRYSGNHPEGGPRHPHAAIAGGNFTYSPISRSAS